MAERHYATLGTWPIAAEEEVNIPAISIQQVDLAFAGQSIFKNLNLDIPPARWVGLLGASGIGKSSLLRLIANLRHPQQIYSGNIIADNNIGVENQTAYMAQTDLLLPWMNVLNNTLLSIKLRSYPKAQQQEKKSLAISLLNQVGLNDVMHHYPHQLSGGMRQRAALVRTLLEDKPIVLMDEPFSSLDAITRYKLQALAANLLRGKTVIFVTHDPIEALRLANDVYILYGKPAQLKLVTQLETALPRSLSDPAVIELQSLLFNELAE